MKPSPEILATWIADCTQDANARRKRFGENKNGLHVRKLLRCTRIQWSETLDVGFPIFEVVGMLYWIDVPADVVGKIERHGQLA